MSEPNKAVFLSYASQDAEAARRICDALRQADIEVWFDQSELRGGDAWDANIRRQIKECALFVPIISANTQRRPEGYFRLEWHLAEQRSHLIARSRAFIVPVTIDQIDDTDALVPDAFLTVQWMRVPGGEATPAFCERVKALLTGEPEARSRERSGSRTEPSRPPLAPATKSRPIWLWVMLALIGVLAAYLIIKPRRTPEEVAKLLSMAQTVVDHATAKPAAPTAPPSEARQLVQQALTLLRGVNVVRADLETAEQFFEKAKTLDPTDGEVWAVGAMIDEGYVLRFYDTSDTRKGEARAKAARALKLAPHSFEARLAQAAVLNTVVNEPSVRPETEQLINSLLAEKPDDRWALIERGRLLWTDGHLDEALACYRRANDPISEGHAYLWMGRLDDAEKAANRAISLGYSVTGLLLKAAIEEDGREDLDAAQAAIDQLPASELLEDTTAAFAANLRLCRREPDKVLAIMRALPTDWIRWWSAPLPKAEWTAFAHYAAGRMTAAKTDWRASLRLVEERLAQRSNDPDLLSQKAWFLGCLGEYDEAQRTFRLDQQLRGHNENEITADTALGSLWVFPERRDEVIDAYARTNHLPEPHAWLRYHPMYDPLRGDPRFEKLLRDTLPKGAKPFDDQKPAVRPAPEAKK